MKSRALEIVTLGSLVLVAGFALLFLTLGFSLTGYLDIR